jgi:hypothetical protein
MNGKRATAQQRQTTNQATSSNSAQSEPVGDPVASRVAEALSKLQSAGYSDPWWRKFLFERNRCQYRDTAGRQCRSERPPGDPTYCIRHAHVGGSAQFASRPLCRDAEASGSAQFASRLLCRDAESEGGHAHLPSQPAGSGREGKNHTDSTWWQLFGPLHDVRSATGINYTLGRLLLLKAEGCVGPKDAAVIAYICQLLLQTLPLVEREAASVELQEPAREKLRRTILATSCLLPNLHATPTSDEDNGEGGTRC